MPYSEEANLRIFLPAPYSNVCPIAFNIQKMDPESTAAAIHQAAFIFVQQPFNCITSERMKEVDLYGKLKNVQLLLNEKLKIKLKNQGLISKNTNPCHILQYIQK